MSSSKSPQDITARVKELEDIVSKQSEFIATITKQLGAIKKDLNSLSQGKTK